MFATTGCGSNPNEIDTGKLKVVATTSILADVVAEIGADLVDLNVLLPPGADAHTFQPTPGGIALVASADAIFINGLGLEAFLQNLLDNAGGGALVLSVSTGIEPLALAADELDPHVWLDPANVMLWADVIAAALSELDPENADGYRANADAYQAELRALDAWIQAQVAEIPVERRLLVSDHHAFGYFAARYGFEIVGAIIPGISTLAEPSARQMAALQDAIRESGAPAIFVSDVGNAVLAQRLADDTGVQTVLAYIGALSGKDGPAATYIQLMRFNVEAIVRALR
ncbi:MAG: zinc ABC transporter substrate-binding protein [Chloroflexi bacterium]|nr:zinc ABC transporter substrate-binding protein [Chloroflexota bacterium]